MADVIILGGGQEMPENYPRIQRSLGPYRVASELKKHGYDVVVIDYIQYLSAEEIINALSKVLTDKTLWIGYSSTFFYSNNPTATATSRMYQNISYPKISEIYSYVKNNSNAKIVFGGARALQAHSDPLVDYYVASYADVSSVDLTNFLAGKVSDIEHKQDIIIGETKSVLIDSGKYKEPEMKSLDTFWHDDSFNLLPQEAVPLEFARGCIFKCKFCSYPLLGKKKGTYIRDMNQVKDELVKLWEVHGTDTFYVTDDTFNDDNDKMEDFHKLFTSLPFKPKFTAFLRLDLINKYPHQADLLLEAGLIGNFFGIESLNYKSAKAIGKGLHPDKVKQRLEWVREKWNGKVNTGVGFIIGLPYDDDAYFKELYDYVTSSNYPAQHTVFNALHIFDKSKGVNLYGSEFSMNAEIYGYKFNEQGWYHEEQNLTFSKCRDIANEFNNVMRPRNKVAEFQMTTYLNAGVPLSDLINLKQFEIERKYNIPVLNDMRLMMYKQMIGAI
jgi:radical SAM superfamily enzyme YgiQ (UPF0313 family)